MYDVFSQSLKTARGRPCCKAFFWLQQIHTRLK
jgi:hypothetical protein